MKCPKCGLQMVGLVDGWICCGMRYWFKGGVIYNESYTYSTNANQSSTDKVPTFDSLKKIYDQIINSMGVPKQEFLGKPIHDSNQTYFSKAMMPLHDESKTLSSDACPHCDLKMLKIENDPYPHLHHPTAKLYTYLHCPICDYTRILDTKPAPTPTQEVVQEMPPTGNGVPLVVWMGRFTEWGMFYTPGLEGDNMWVLTIYVMTPYGYRPMARCHGEANMPLPARQDRIRGMVAEIAKIANSM